MRYIVNENGVIIDELQEGDRIVRSSSIKALNGKERIVYKNFCILNISEYKAIMSEISGTARSVLAQLIPYVQYSSCLLAFSNGKPINGKHLCGITGLSRNTVEKGILELVEKNVLYKRKNLRKVQYYINPYIVHRGQLVNRTLRSMFRNYRRRG